MRLVSVRRRARPVLASLTLAAAVVVALPIGADATPGGTPAPTVASVTAKLDALARQTERLAEQYNKAQIDVATAQRAASAAQGDSARAAARFQAARTQLSATIIATYEGGAFSTTGALLSSADGNSYLDQLSTLDLVSRQQSAVIASISSRQAAADATYKRARALLREAETKQRAVRAQRAKVADETTKFTALLRSLTPAQQTAYATRGSASPAQISSLRSVHAGSAAAQRAVDFALAQVGKPYSFGAAGPGAYDCSGLTMAAWAAGGVSLPHLAASQYDYGTHVSMSQLQPGDLVFLYHPIGHVSIYVGNGVVVSAPQAGENVKIVPVSHFAADFAGATRLK